MSKLLELATACETAQCGSRELDAAIAAAVRLDKVPDWARNWAGEWRPNETGSVVMMHSDGTPGPHFMSREYTASVDAAITLVPNRYKWFLKADATGNLPFIYTAEICKRETGRDRPFFSYPSVNPALAICVAALRARHAMLEQSA